MRGQVRFYPRFTSRITAIDWRCALELPPRKEFQCFTADGKTTYSIQRVKDLQATQTKLHQAGGNLLSMISATTGYKCGFTRWEYDYLNTWFLRYVCR